MNDKLKGLINSVKPVTAATYAPPKALQVQAASAPSNLNTPISSAVLKDTLIKEKFLTDYERPLLAIALRDSLKLAELRQKVSDEHFLYMPHKIIFSALCGLQDDPNINKIDLNTLYTECKSRSNGEDIVSAQYLGILDAGVAEDSNFVFYLDKVKNAYNKYALYTILQSSLLDIEKNALDVDGHSSGLELADKTSASVAKISLNSDIDNRAISFADRAEEYVLERAADDQAIKGLPTGIPTLDMAINGLMPGSLTVIAGRAKAGKSTIMLNIVEHLAVPSPDKDFEPVPMLLISTEMYSDEDISRLLAMTAMIEERKISNGQAYRDPVERKYVEAALKQVKQAKIYHIYMPDFNADEVCALITYFKLKHQIGLAVFDYIKMETLPNEAKDFREDQILGNITDALKRTAGKLNIPILTGCQLGRSNMVADSDRIVRYCNTLIELVPKSEEELEKHEPLSKYGTHWLKVTAARGGGNRKIPISFYKPCLKILEAEVFYEDGDSEESGSEAPTLLSKSDSLVTPRHDAKVANNRLAKGLSAGGSLVNRASEAFDSPSQVVWDDYGSETF